MDFTIFEFKRRSFSDDAFSQANPLSPIELFNLTL
jgi:hypothetical protein